MGKHTLHTFVALMLLGTPSGMAQETVPPLTVTDRFGEELMGLKSSADQLAAGNASLAVKDQHIKDRLAKQQLRLQQLAQEGNTLTRNTLVLQDINPTKAKQIAALEKEIFEADAAMERLTEQMKAGLESMDKMRGEDMRLSAQLSGVPISPVTALPTTPLPVAGPITGDHEKEKLRLLKMIADSKIRQQEIYLQMGNAQSGRGTQDVVTVETSNQKENLQNQVRKAQEDIAQLGAMMQQPVEGNAQLDQLKEMEAQVRDLQKNHDELETLVWRMQQKAAKTGEGSDQTQEEARLQRSLDDINKEARRLKQDLTDLRQKMVELDKRKTYLEGVLGR